MPPVAARDVRRCRGWQRHLQLAMIETGHNQMSLGAALGVTRQRVAQWLQPGGRRELTLSMIERLRDSRDTHDLWRWLLWAHAEEAAMRVGDERQQTGGQGA